jgi:hypothetical protein
MRWFRRAERNPLPSRAPSPTPTPTPTPLRQRADCPHAPHDGPCGAVHDGPCVLVHQGACAALMPMCPACRTVRIGVYVPSIVAKVRDEGTHIAGCGECGELSFSYDATLVCGTCDWLVPDVNDQLAARFAANGGPFVAKLGVCPGCGLDGAGHPVSFPIRCPSCATASRCDQQAVDTSIGATASCSNNPCGFAIRIPATIWCPECRLNLRDLATISSLIKEANKGAV